MNRYTEFKSTKTIAIPAPTVIVGSVGEIVRAVDTAASGDVIGIMPGTYDMPGTKVRVSEKDNITIRSVSGGVIFEGSGFHKKDGYKNTTVDNLLTITDNSRNVLVHGIEFANSNCHGVKIEGEANVRDITISACSFKNINERMIKGSKGDKGYRVGRVLIANCTFENTELPYESDHTAEFTGDYIAGIDMMVLDDATIYGCKFKNIRGVHGGARGAIFLWVESKNVTAEYNKIENCDRGICFGNPHNVNGIAHVDGGLMKENTITGVRGQAIELAWTNDVTIEGNSLEKGISDTGDVKSTNVNFVK